MAIVKETDTETGLTVGYILMGGTEAGRVSVGVSMEIPQT